MEEDVEVRFRCVERTQMVEQYVRMRAERLWLIGDRPRRCLVDIERTPSATLDDPYRAAVCLALVDGRRLTTLGEDFDELLAIRNAFDKVEVLRDDAAFTDARGSARRSP